MPGYITRQLVAEKVKKAEEQIREQAALLDKAQDAICVTDLDQRIIYWNKSAELLYGWTIVEVLGKYANELLFKTNSSQAMEALKGLIAKREWKGELRQINRLGTDLIVESRWTLIHDAGGKPKSKLEVVGDVPKSRTGTTIRFWPDPKYFDSDKFAVPKLKQVLRAKAVLLPGVRDVAAPFLRGSNALRNARCRHAAD
jgi:PAS domain S-box-containing protein